MTDHGPRLMCTGEQTAKAVAKLLPTANAIVVPSNLGNVELRPGSIWSGERMLVQASPSTVWYTVGDNFYEWWTSSFVRDEWMNALSAGAARAKGMITLAKVEVALLTGLFAPWYLLLGVGVAKLGLFYHNNQSLVDSALKQAPKVLSLLREFKERYPTLFNKLAMTAAKDILINLPLGVTAEDVAFFVGRVVKGVGGLPQMTLGAVLRTATVVAAIVGATHLPSIAAHGMASAAAKQVAVLRARLAEVGIQVSEQEAKKILQELQAHKDTESKLKQLQAGCQQLLPVLDQLTNALRTGG